MRKTEEYIINFINKKKKIFRKIKKGIGDDCAVINNFAITKDVYVEGTHFSEKLNPEIVGWKTFAGAVSDIAAIGGEPLFFLLGIGMPKEFSIKSFKNLIVGIFKLANKFKIQIIGGDTIRSKELLLSYTIIGKVIKPIYRSGAKKNDFVYLTGDLGGSRLGYEFNVKNKKFLYPIPKIKEVKYILKRYKINSMIDISDGLIIDATRISKESKVRIDLFKDKIPFNKMAIEYCKKKGLDPFDFCANSGEEYEILFTSPDKLDIKGVSMIGKVSEGIGVYINNQKIIHRGYKHFDED